jgi:NifU-like protein involved in Fe-S cluster formation
VNASVSYNDAVRRHFADPRHAGDLANSFDKTISADVSDSDKGARIVMSAGIRDGTIAAAAFRAWGCPHLIAALDLACERLTGQPVQSLEKYDLAHITQELGVPAEKAGRILLLEDALATLWAQFCGATD